MWFKFKRFCFWSYQKTQDPNLFCVAVCIFLGCTDAAPRRAHPRPTRRDAGGTPQTARPCCVVPRGDSRIRPTRLKSAPMRPKSGRLGPYQPVSAESAETAELGRNSKKKKKKKGAKRTIWLNLNTQTPSDPHTSSKTPKHPLSLRPSSPFSVCSVPHLSSLCSELSVSVVCTLHCFRH